MIQPEPGEITGSAPLAHRSGNGPVPSRNRAVVYYASIFMPPITSIGRIRNRTFSAKNKVR